MISLIRLIITLLALYLAYRAIKWLLAGGSVKSGTIVDDHPSAIEEELVEDPCCRRYVPSSKALALSENGQTHHFCSQTCLDKFKKENGIQ